jgi:ABC-2 type transport system ATP-binding protein
MSSIEIQGLTVVYPGGARALDGVDLAIETGLFGLLGPNGAGKTTMMKVLATLLRPTSGSARVLGHDVVTERGAIRSQLGFLPQEFGAYRILRTAEFLDYMARLAGVPGDERARRVDETLEQVGLDKVRERKIKKLSGGMLRRLGVAQALVGHPRVLIVDEPTVGLDPEERGRFRALIAELAADRVILLSTHIVSDIAGACADMALLVKGRVAFRGSPAALTERARGRTFELDVLPPDLERQTQGLAVISTVERDGALRVRAVGDPAARSGAELVEPTLEDAYVAFMESQAAAQGGGA